MSKTESSLPNMILTLVLVTLVAGGALGYIFQLTKAPISEAKKSKQQEAIRQVVPPYNNNPGDDMYEIKGDNGTVFKVFPARQDDELTGVAIESTTTKGYGGEIKMMVGFKPDGSIYNYQVLEHKETPGLGSKMNEWFRPVAKGGSGSENRNSFFDKLFGIKSGQSGDSKSIIGKNPGRSNLSVSKDGGEIDAITAATISSRAFLDAVRQAYASYTKTVDAHSSETSKKDTN